MSDRCFCHFNGYEVKDAAARKMVAMKATVFDTVADMIDHNITIGEAAQTLGFHTINDGGAAMYKIAETGDRAANGADIIELKNGLVAVLVADVANVKQYGAYCDMKNDDSAAFNLACASGKDVYIPSGNYIIKTIVQVPKNGSRKIYSDAMGASGACLYMYAGAYFNVTEQSVFFDNVRFIGSVQQHHNEHRAIIAEDIDPNEYDADLWVKNCIFSWIQNPIYVKDRGCQVSETMFVCCGDSITFEYIGGGATNTPLTDSVMGGRGLCVHGCRFHAHEDIYSAITIKSGSSAFNPIISDCEMDAGYGNFVSCYGDIYGGVISGNVVNFTDANAVAIRFHGKAENCIIANNSFQNWNDRWTHTENPIQIIRFVGSYLSGAVIRGNVFRGSKQWAITLNSTTQENVLIEGNLFDKIGSTSDADCPILFTKPITGCIINNNIQKNAPDVCTYFVRSTSSATKMTNSVILGNVIPDHVSTVWSNSVPADQNTIQDY